MIFVKRILVFGLLLLIPCVLPAQPTPPRKPKVLVVYYSREGHTKLVAEALAKRFEADIEQLIDKKKRTGLVGFSTAGKDAVAGNLTKLEPLKKTPGDYDVILIGTPSWFGNMSPAVRTFVSEHDLSGKRISVFGTAHLTGVENALKQIAELIRKEDPESILALPLRHRDLKDGTFTNAIDSFYAEIFAETRNE